MWLPFFSFFFAENRFPLPCIVTVSMKWTCKLCSYSSSNQRTITRHYTLKHRHFSRFCPLPCLYKDCVCTFKKQIDLKRHLLRQHGPSQNSSAPLTVQILCDLCSFSEPCNLRQYLAHLCCHLKNKGNCEMSSSAVLISF